MSDLFGGSIEFLLLREDVFVERENMCLVPLNALFLIGFLLKKTLQCPGHALKCEKNVPSMILFYSS